VGTRAGLGNLYLILRKILNEDCVKIKQKITTVVTNAIIFTLNLKLMMFVLDLFYFYIHFMGHKRIKL
jgi:hypothetical protein